MKKIISLLLTTLILFNIVVENTSIKVLADTINNENTDNLPYKPYDPTKSYNQNLIIKDINRMARSTGLSPNDVLAVGTTACAFLPQTALIAGGVTLAIYLGYKLYKEISAEGYIREDGSIRTSKAYFDSIRLKLENLCGTRDTLTLQGEQLYPTVTTNVWTYYYNGKKTCNLVNYTPAYAGPYRYITVEASTDLPYQLVSQRYELKKYSLCHLTAYSFVDMYVSTSNPIQTFFYFKGSKSGDTLFAQTFAGTIPETIFNLYAKITFCDTNYNPLPQDYVVLDENQYNVVIPIVDDLLDTPIIPRKDEETVIDPYDIIINPITLPDNKPIYELPLKDIVNIEPVIEVPDTGTTPNPGPGTTPNPDTKPDTKPETKPDPNPDTNPDTGTEPEVPNTSPLTGLIEILQFVFTPLFNWLTAFFTMLADFFEPLFNWLDVFFNNLRLELKPITEWLTNFFTNLDNLLKNIFQPLFNWIGDFFTSLGNLLQTIFKPLFNWIGDFFTSLGNILQTIFKPLFDWLLECPSMLWNLLVEIFKPVLDLATDLWTKLKQTMSDLFIPTVDLKTAFEIPEDKTLKPLKDLNFRDLLYITPKPIRFFTTVHFGSITHDIKLYFDEVDVIMDNIELIRNLFSYTLLLISILTFIYVMLPKRTMD